MIEIRTFEGTAAELTDFTNRMWRHSYEGKMLCPQWSENLFQRELFSPEAANRPFLVAAYDGTRLVGSHPAKPIRIRLHGREMPATWGSFLTVDPEYRGQRIAQRMQEEFVRRHQEYQAAVNFGYLYLRSVQSMGPKFWLSQPQLAIIRKVGMWIRALDHRAVARFELNRFEAWGTRFLSLFQRRPKPPATSEGVRLYAAADLPQCRQLIHGAGAEAELAYLWDSETLGNQLLYPGLSNTLVAEVGSQLVGLVNYTLIPVLGKTRLTSAFIDIVAFARGCPRRLRRRLFQAALHQMFLEGAQGAGMLRTSFSRWRDMAGAGFFPMLPEYYFCGTRMQEGIRLDGIRRMQVIWR